MSVADRMNFSQEKIFKIACENLEKSNGKTKNLIDCKDDFIFVWDTKRKRLLTQNLRVLNRDETVYQELCPTKPPLTDIYHVRLNTSVTKAALWGPDGVTIMEIPRRWGSQSGFQGGKPVILTKSCTIDLQYVLLHDAEICQVRFHPGSPQDNHLVILTSDNALRAFELAVNDFAEGYLPDPQIVQIWTLGQNPAEGRRWNLSGSKILTSLGDTAVDFDFGLPTMDGNCKEDEFGMENVVWPTFVLRGNGDVCYLDASLNSNQKVKFEGPLLMYPPADDNYGVEACSLLVLDTVPNAIVVATSSGTLYHSVVLEVEKNEDSVISSNATHALYVTECVELELGIQLNDDDPSYTCPVILHKDPISRSKYYATHNAGLHAVSVSFVSKIESFFEKVTSENPLLDHPSTVEYLVCTRTNSTPILPVAGFAIVTATNVIAALLADGEIVSLPMRYTEPIANVSFAVEGEGIAADEDGISLKKLLQGPFDVRIRGILQKKIGHPLVKLDKKDNLTTQEYLDLVSKTSNFLRREYFAKFQLVTDETTQRVMILKALLALHREELSQLESEKSNMQAMAEKLAEKYEEVTDQQQLLKKKIEKVLSTILELEPIESLAEKKMKNELLAVEEKVEYFDKSITRLKKEMNYQKLKVDESEPIKPKDVQLGGNLLETIKKNLNNTSQEIAELVKIVNCLKKQLNIGDA